MCSSDLEWLPIDRLMKLIDDSHTEYTSTQRVGSGHPISGSVICHIRSRSERLAGQLESISHAEVTIVLTEPLVVQSALFELEVNPDSNTGMEPFKATVKADAARSAKNKHVLVFVQTSPKTKMSIERYLRSLPI